MSRLKWDEASATKQEERRQGGERVYHDCLRALWTLLGTLPVIYSIHEVASWYRNHSMSSGRDRKDIGESSIVVDSTNMQ
jgi:hypothetical protein